MSLEIFLLGRGNVGGALLELLGSRRDFHLACVLGRDSDRSQLLERISRSPHCALVDCTAAEGMEKLYLHALRSGAHVVTANKKPFTAKTALRDQLFATARATRRALKYETTVGAGLPVIEPLKDLVRTGDALRRIEGSFSGTLGHLCQELFSGVALSRAVASARELGYTEPHPRDDLSGTDVARKALILAREAGLRLELDDVHVDPFVPERFLREDDPAKFLAALEDLDGDFADRIRQHARDGRVPRYLARIDIAERTAAVGLQWVEPNHPAAQLQGTESLVTYSTARYRPHPMRIQGPGAGAHVTAAGVLADLCYIAAACELSARHSSPWRSVPIPEAPTFKAPTTSCSTSTAFPPGPATSTAAPPTTPTARFN